MVKRQSEQNCQCKDGSPGPRGPPGNKGEIGMEGKEGHKGDTGPTGPRGDARNRGPRGKIGMQYVRIYTDTTGLFPDPLHFCLCSFYGRHFSWQNCIGTYVWIDGEGNNNYRKF